MKRLFLAVALLAFFSTFWTITNVHAAGAPMHPRAAAGQQAAVAGNKGYVGSETCLTCHADIGKNFPENPHSRLALMHEGKGLTCESCHGPGQAHVESGGDPTKVLFNFNKMSPQQIDARCLTCHAAAHPNFERSPHAKAGVSCLSCHSVHKAMVSENLLKQPQPQLCESCHADVRLAFAQPFHHKVPEGMMKCTDCHDPHGTFQSTQLRSTADQNAICTKCHTETAGPFVYEHPVVKTEGCISCHSPHGSPNPRLLKVSNVNTLCLQCHSASMNFTEPGAPGFHNQATQYQACTICHTQVHGSNTSSVFFK